MFTGIITDQGRIIESTGAKDKRVVIATAYVHTGIALGESIAVNGACMTVVDKGYGANNWFTIDISQESVARTAPGMWEVGRTVNLERSLKVGDLLSGHFVTGHVDGVALVENIVKIGDSYRLDIRAPEALARFIAPKGSVTLDGVALTVNTVENALFSVNIIPHTWEHTTLRTKRVGSALNMEIDLLARYMARLLEKE